MIKAIVNLENYNRCHSELKRRKNNGACPRFYEKGVINVKYC